MRFWTHCLKRNWYPADIEAKLCPTLLELCDTGFKNLRLGFSGRAKMIQQYTPFA
jgi:hypothetical protein